MRGVVFKGDRKVEIMNFADPVPGPGEAVIEIKASGMCGSDLHFFRHGPAEVIRALGFKDLAARGIDEHAPIIGGHEPSGVVAALGHDVDAGAFKIGDRVMVFHYDGCKYCDSCRTGWTQLCDQGATVYGVIAHGAHADYMKVPVSSLLHLPQEVSFAGGAAVSCGTGTAYGALLRLDISARDTLAVFGLGPVGLSAAQLAAAMGVEVIGVDISAERVERAKAFGVAHAIDGSKLDAVSEIHKLTGGKGVSCAMDCAGGEVPRLQAVRATRPWGKIALVAIGGNFTADAMKDLIGKQRTIVGSYTFSSTGMKACAHFIANHGVDVDAIFTDRWRLDEASAAYRAFDAQAGGKGVFAF
ncbi:Zinc-containing alcohol dehydrogenase superfamily [Paraburkholderia piptadeniae]|uniref:Zinc-containing alcohol dehydrogenase superfamily n=1 Tax=Paraburkholderia piptadeniae TaxID=1701573 RepID=A0A1N7S330_9BURK|nr:zinc-binding dehydrogenase [Paraburkholderia piptadeniae]SIT41746.1 Zinc-containing alcohol dehydrogenase superfamily [Paraburkholderia piptadeniae]